MNIDTLAKYVPHKVLQRRVRKAAVKRVRKELILRGRKEADIAEQDLEYLLADAEKDIFNELKQSTLVGALALLGIGYF